MTKFASRMDGAESLGPTGRPATVAPAVGETFTANADAGGITHATIPDYPGAQKGLLGVKAPFSYRQEDEIRDRLVGAGVIKNDKV
jgi:hypothetical protein